MTLPENAGASQPLQLSMLNSGGTKVADYQIEVMPDSGYASLGSEQDFAGLASGGDEFNLSLTPIANQQFIGPTANDSAAFSVASRSPFGFGFNWGNFEITILDVTIILPIVNEVYLIPFFDGGDALNSPVLAEVGKIFRLRGAGLLVAIRVEVQIHIQVVLIIGFYYRIWNYGFYNEFPEYGWSIGSVVIGIRIEIQVLFYLSAMVALIKPNGQLEVLAAVNLSLGIDFSIDQNGRLHFGSDFTYQPYVIGISPVANNPLPCGNKFELLPQNGLAAIPDAYGFEAQYAVHEAGDCCLPWDFNVRLLRFTSNGQQEVVQEGFQTSYCLTAIQPPEVKVNLALAYKDSDGNVQNDNGIYRDEPTDMTEPDIDINDPTKVRNYFLAAKFDFPTYPSFPVTVKVTVDSAALNVNPDISGTIPFPSGTFGSKFDRSSGTTIGQFFKGSLLQNGLEASLTLHSLPGKDQYVLFDNANIVPNRVEVFGTNSATNQYVAPGPKVTAHLLSACQATDQNAQNNTTCRRSVGVKLTFNKDFKITDSSGSALPSSPITSPLEVNVINGETFEEYFRVFHEIRDLMRGRAERTTSGTLGSFATELIRSLSQSASISNDFLRERGKKLWELGYQFVQNHFTDSKVDDRILYFSRLEAMAALRDVLKMDLPPLTPNQLNIFEYSSRGFDISDDGKDVHIGFQPTETNRVVVTGFDPFQLYKEGLISNSAGLIAMNLHEETISVGNPRKNFKIRTAVFPVRFRDFDSGLVERVMQQAVKECALIMTCSWTPDGKFNIDRFATRYRVMGAPDNEKITSATNFPLGGTLSDVPYYLESTLPYTPIGVVKVLNPQKNNLPENRKVSGPSNPTYVVINQTFTLDTPKKCADRPGIDPATGEFLPKENTKDAYEKNDKKGDPNPRNCGELAEGSGGNYLSNEIFYRTSRIRRKTKPGLPTGHLHMPTIGTEPYLEDNTGKVIQDKGEKVIRGGTEILIK